MAVTAAFSIGLGMSAVASIPVGRWLDRHGPSLGVAGVAVLLVGRGEA